MAGRFADEGEKKLELVLLFFLIMLYFAPVVFTIRSYAYEQMVIIIVQGCVEIICIQQPTKFCNSCAENSAHDCDIP